MKNFLNEKRVWQFICLIYETDVHALILFYMIELWDEFLGKCTQRWDIVGMW